MARSKQPKKSPRRVQTKLKIYLDTGIAPVRAGHPWIFRDKSVQTIEDASAGSEVAVFDAGDGSFLARGLYDPDSQIAIRLMTWKESEACSSDLIDRRLQRAIEKRGSLPGLEDTDAYRLIHGEGDGLPGLVVDRYGPFGVMRIYSSIWQRHISWIGERIRDLASLDGLAFEDRRREGREPLELGSLIAGEELPEHWTINECSHEFAATSGDRMKTGLYLDGREHRRTVARYASGATVLNLFSYTAAYSVWAAKAGALKTVNVDLGKNFQNTAEDNFARNGLDPTKHEFVIADAFDYLERAKHKFDLVIIDPPSFSTGKKSVLTMKKSYQKLVSSACRHVRRDGILAIASNMAQTPMDEFLALAGRGTRHADRDWSIAETRGLPVDFPSVPALPQSRYLKFAIGPLG